MKFYVKGDLFFGNKDCCDMFVNTWQLRYQYLMNCHRLTTNYHSTKLSFHHFSISAILDIEIITSPWRRITNGYRATEIQNSRKFKNRNSCWFHIARAGNWYELFRKNRLFVKSQNNISSCYIGGGGGGGGLWRMCVWAMGLLENVKLYIIITRRKLRTNYERPLVLQRWLYTNS